MWGPASFTRLTAAEARVAALAMPDRIKKGSSTEGMVPGWKLVGIASTEHKDVQDDVIRQDGLDWRPFLKRGFFNDDHGKGTRDIVGYPTRVFLTTVRDPKLGKVKATAVEGYLFDTAKARGLVELAKAMEGTPREMGLSVEGPPPKRSPSDPHDIVSGVVEHCAITPWAVNGYTNVRFEATRAAKSLAKSLAAVSKAARAGYPGDSGAGSLRAVMPESGIARAPLAVVSLDALAELAEDWVPANKPIPRGKLSKADARALVRRHFPRADSQTVDRIVHLARRGR